MELYRELERKAEELLRVYYCERDWDKTLRFFDREDVTWVSVGAFTAATYEELCMAAQTHEQVVPEGCILSGVCLRATAMGDQACLVTGNYTASLSGGGNDLFCGRRVSILFVLREGIWKVTHLHLSAPSTQITAGGDIPGIVDSYDNGELRRVLNEKNAQIEMITKTTAGGMKGSIDDEFYTFYYVSEGLCSMLGYTREEFMEMSGGTAVGAVYPPDLPAALAACAECFEKGPEYRAEYRIRKKDGSLLWVQDRGSKVGHPDGTVLINSIIIDISELKETLNNLRIERERYEIVAELSEDIIFEYDMLTDTLEQFFPPTAGRAKKRVITQNVQQSSIMCAPAIHPEDVARLREVLCGLAGSGTADFESADFRQNTPDGSYHWYRALSKQIRDSDGNPIRTVGKVEDIHAQRRLLTESQTDMLTGAYNRSYLNHTAEEYLLNKSEDVIAAYMLIDIDHFKQINDTYGHLQGDQVLIGLVELLKKIYRISDVKTRLGGDEFVVFMKDLYSIDIVNEKAEKLRKMFDEFGRTIGIAEKCTLSIGISVADTRDTKVNTLYREADIALYQAKAMGRNCVCMYQQGMQYPRGKV